MTFRELDRNFSISQGNSSWIPAFAGIQLKLAKHDLPELIENLR